MAQIDDALAFNTARGFSDWAALTSVAQNAALAKAGDYILANYHLRDPMTFSTGDTTRYSTATFLLAREFVTNPLPLRMAQTIKREQDSASTGLFQDVTYFDVPVDPYPQITTLLAPLLWNANVPNYSVGQLVRGPSPWRTTNDC